MATSLGCPMVTISLLKRFLDRELQIKKFRTDAKNGLVVRGKREVTAIAVAANTSFANIRAAAKARADLLIVHHGGWRSADGDLLRKKFALLRKHKISLYIAHAPLDCKAGYGNSIALAHHLGLKVVKRFASYYGAPVGVFATQPTTSLSTFLRRLRNRLNQLDYVGKQHATVRKIAIITGGMGRNIPWVQQAVRAGCDTFLCGEANSLFKLYTAEKGITLICAGHTATERHGLLALGEVLKQKFSVRIMLIKEILY